MTNTAPGGHSYFLVGQENRWLPWIVISLLLHTLFFTVAWLESQKTYSPDLVHKNAIMVKPVAFAPKARPKHWMPVKESKQPEAIKKPEAIKLSKNTDQKKEIKEKKKPEKTKAQIKKEKRNRRRGMSSALDRIKKRQLGSPDGVRGAYSAKALQILGSAYAAKLINLFKSNFSVPEVIPTKEYKKLKCKILVKIDRTGRITNHSLKNSSGNSHFDSSALKAVRLTRQVPTPDEELQDLVFSEGIVINFVWQE